MVRKRTSKKDRNAGSKPKPPKRSDAKMKRWETVDDIPMDEEDQFHHNRDKILLDGNSREMMDEEDDEEVFALKGMEDDSDSDAGADYDEDDFAEEEEEEAPAKKEKEKKKKDKKDKKAKGKKKTDESEEEQEEEEEESWGKGRGAYYSSNADQLESDDEEGYELEEQEAKRLQAKAREELKDDDFGLNDNPEIENQDEAEDVLDAVPSVLPPPTTDKKELMKHLEKTSPESLALARDWEHTVHKLQRAKEKMEKVQAETPDALSLGMLHLHYQSLLSYSTMLAFYLHMRASAKYAQRPHLLKSHPILQRLLTLKQSLSTLEDLDFGADSSDEEDDEEDEEDDEEDEEDDYSMDSEEMKADREMLWSMDRDSEGDEADSVDLDSDELAELMKDAKVSLEAGPSSKKSKPPKKKQRVQEEETSSEEEEEERPTKKSKSKTEKSEKKEKKSKLVTPIFDLVEPEFVSSKPSAQRKKSTPSDDVLDAFGESTALHTVDAADKSARKKSLRFHTSKIESASARRQGARTQAAGGDDDIPYRERKSAKDARLVKEAAIRAQNQVGAPLDDTDPEPQVGQKRPRDDDDDEGGESPDEYYELVKKKSKDKKEKKKEEYEAATRERIVDDSEVSGPRSLTRAIMANKGLTPHRPKAVRNPRVKKRQKFEKAKKKIASQKAVYKGGLSETGGKYGGERSGISKVVKSVTLG